MKDCPLPLSRLTGEGCQSGEACDLFVLQRSNFRKESQQRSGCHRAKARDRAQDVMMPRELLFLRYTLRDCSIKLSNLTQYLGQTRLCLPFQLG